MAEEFLQPSRRDYMEFVGNMFFNVLLQNSLLQVAMKDDYGNVESCVMHDLASSVVSNNADDSIVVRYKFLEEESSPIPKNVAKHLLTLFLKGGIPGTIFSNFQCLHYLTLFGDYKEFPNSIREMLSAEIGRLTSLHTLRCFTVGKEKGFQIEELGSLKNLTGSVEIQDLEMVHDKEEALKANIFQKPNLFKLAFRWSDGREDETNDESVLEGIQPHSNLKKLEISGFKGIRFPTWDEKMVARDGPQGSLVPLDNLIGIELIGCSEIEEIPTLEHLPNLKSVSLKRLKKVRLINAWFNHLTSLQIEELDRLDCLPEWILYNNQNLSFLYISKCGVLRELPDGFIT
ncbi:putative disease resistance protein RGA1 [Salvia splendens]|uniref:putative disease resistance protein RGA1 n=1 Tax=Salvia splendens TaxID=180675 RepID=UPI001C259042|nr:putative disease resistance protein RGA1 [Salvia splendens]